MLAATVLMAATLMAAAAEAKFPKTIPAADFSGKFRGWEGRTAFTLENGQRWQSAGESTYISPPILKPAVKITPGMLGTFWMTVEGVRQRVKVAIIETAK